MGKSACGRRFHFTGSKAFKARQLRKKIMVEEVDEPEKHLVALQGELSPSNKKVATPKTESEEVTVEALRIKISQMKQKKAALQSKVGNLRDELEHATKYNEEKVLGAKYEAHYIRTTLQFCRAEVKDTAWKEKANLLKNVLCQKRKSLEAERITKSMFTKDEEWRGNINSVNNIFCDQIKLLEMLLVKLENNEV